MRQIRKTKQEKVRRVARRVHENNIHPGFRGGSLKINERHARPGVCSGGGGKTVP